jgi:hypothetical protein
LQNFTNKAVGILSPKEHECVFANVKALQASHVQFFKTFSDFISPVLLPTSHEAIEISDVVKKAVCFGDWFWFRFRIWFWFLDSDLVSDLGSLFILGLDLALCFSGFGLRFVDRLGLGYFDCLSLNI